MRRIDKPPDSLAYRITPSYRETSLPSSRSPAPAKPQRRTQAERSEAMRARLAAAAFETIAQGGFNALRMRNVASAAGVSQGALMHHFPDKNALVLAAVEQALELARAESGVGELAPGTPPEDVLRALLADLHGFFFSDRFWVAMGITMEVSRDAEIYPAVQEAVRALRLPTYQRWADRLADAGWPAETASAAVRSAAGLLAGQAVRRFWAEPDALDDRLVEQWLAEWLARR